VRVNRDFLGWGLFLILLGAIPLAVRQGLIDADAVRGVWQLWPLILIGIGIGLVLRRTPAEFLGGLLVAGTFGLLAGSLLAVGFAGFAGFPFVGGGCNIPGGGQGTAFAARSGDLTRDATVTLELNCGELTAIARDGDRWTLEGSDSEGQGPMIQQGPDRLRISSREADGFWFGGGAADEWRLVLPTNPGLDLDVSLNAGSARLDLPGTRLDRVDVQVNAGEVRLLAGGAAEMRQLNASVNAGSLSIDLPGQDVTGSVSANAGSIELCVPPGVGLRFRTEDNITASYNFGERGLLRTGNTWESPDFDSATWRIELSASANAGSVTLNPEGGCGE
jgi:hypothetical protein